MAESLASNEINIDSVESFSSNRKDFSFNRTDTRKNSGRSVLKLEEIRHELSQLDAEKLCQLLIQEIQHNEELRAELFRSENKYEGCKEEIRMLTQSLAFKKESFLMLSENQTRNQQQIIRLEQELKSFKERYSLQSWTAKVDSEWQKKYNQLTRHMDIYVENNKEVQEQFARQKQRTEKELQAIYSFNSELNLKLRQLGVANSVQADQLKGLNLEKMELQKQVEKWKNTVGDSHSHHQRIARLEQALVESDQIRSLFEERCKQLGDSAKQSSSLVEQLQAQLSKLEMTMLKQKESLEANRLTTDRQLNQLKLDRERLQGELDTVRLQQTSRHPLEAEIIEVREQNQNLHRKLDDCYKTIGTLKAEVILLKGEADRAKGYMKRQADKNSEIRQELDRFCRRKRDTASPDEVLSHIENTANSVSRKQYLSSHLKVPEFKLEEHTSKFSPGKENRESCIIGDEATG